VTFGPFPFRLLTQQAHPSASSRDHAACTSSSWPRRRGADRRQGPAAHRLVEVRTRDGARQAHHPPPGRHGVVRRRAAPPPDERPGGAEQRQLPPRPGQGGQGPPGAGAQRLRAPPIFIERGRPRDCVSNRAFLSRRAGPNGGHHEPLTTSGVDQMIRNMWGNSGFARTSTTSVHRMRTRPCCGRTAKRRTVVGTGGSR
jgi:hypothetical protein